MQIQEFGKEVISKVEAENGISAADHVKKALVGRYVLHPDQFDFLPGEYGLIRKIVSHTASKIQQDGYKYFKRAAELNAPNTITLIKTNTKLFCEQSADVSALKMRKAGIGKIPPTTAKTNDEAVPAPDKHVLKNTLADRLQCRLTSLNESENQKDPQNVENSVMFFNKFRNCTVSVNVNGTNGVSGKVSCYCGSSISVSYHVGKKAATGYWKFSNFEKHIQTHKPKLRAADENEGSCFENRIQ